MSKRNQDLFMPMSMPVREVKPIRKKSDSHKTAELGRARLEADKRNRLLKERIEEEARKEDAEFDAEYAQAIEEQEGIAQKEPEDKVDEVVEAALAGETHDLAEDVLHEAENELHEAEEEKHHLSEELGPMSKEEKEAYEKDILIRTAVYESWVSYVFRLYEMININANEEIRNEIRIALMEYGHQDVEVLLHSPE